MMSDSTIFSEAISQLTTTLPWLEPLGWVLLHSLWQGVAIALLLALALFLLRDRGPQVRYVLSVVALAALLLAPAATWWVIQPTAPAPQSSEHLAETATLLHMLERSVEAGLLADASESATGAAETSSSTSFDWMMLLPGLAALWMAGVSALMLRLLGGVWYVRRLRTQGVEPLPDSWHRRGSKLAQRLGISRSVRFMQSSRVSVPMVSGWWKPVVLLPVGVLSGMPPQYVQAIIAHELAHVRRHDALVGWLQVVAETLLFYHPATWWISKRIVVEREHCCDDLVVELTGSRLTYARALTRIEEMRSPQWHPVPAASDGHLLNRIRRILGRPSASQELLNGRWSAVLVSLTLSIGILAATVTIAATPLHQTEESADAPIASSVMVDSPPVPENLDEWLRGTEPRERSATETTEEENLVASSDTLTVRGISSVGGSEETARMTREGNRPLVNVIMRADTLDVPADLGPRMDPDTLRAMIHRLTQPDAQQRARLDSLQKRIQQLHRPSPEQRARIDSLRAALQEMSRPSSEQMAKIDSMQKQIRQLIQPSEDALARADSLRKHYQEILQPSAEARAKIDSLRALAREFSGPSAEQLKQQAEALRQQAERLEQQARELEQRLREQREEQNG